MKRTLVLLVTGAFLLTGVAPASAGPVDKVIEWVKDPCVPTGHLEDDCLQ